MTKVITKAVLLVGLLIMFLFLVNQAKAHRAPSGMEYAQYCCNETDCAVVTRTEYDDLGVRYYTSIHKLGVYFTYQDIALGKRGGYNTFRKKVSEDGEVHVCANQYGHNDQTKYWVYCLYLPAGS